MPSSSFSILSQIDSNVLLIQNGYLQKNTSPKKQMTLEHYFTSPLKNKLEELFFSLVIL